MAIHLGLVFLIIVIILIIFIFFIDAKVHKNWIRHHRKTQYPKDEDEAVDMLQKLENLNADTNTDIAWRRSLLIGSIAGIVITLMILKRIPDIVELIIVIGVVFMLTYLFFGWHVAHEVRVQRDTIRCIIKGVREKLSLAVKSKITVL